MKTLKTLTRVQRALIRAGRPFVGESGLQQLRAAHRGRTLTRYDDGRYFLSLARRAAVTREDPLRIHLVQRIYNHASKVVVAESLRQVVERIAEAGNVPARLMLKAFDSSAYHGELTGNFFAYREKEGMISYCPANRVQTFGESGRWERAGRQETTPARWVRSVLRPERVKLLKEHEIAHFAEQFRMEEARGKIEIVDLGQEFAQAYDSSRYTTTEGGLYSCMWDEPVQDFYRGAPCRVLVAKRGDGKYVGRAIVWDEVTGTGGAQFMDRIYLDSPETRHLFAEYAKEHGMWKKEKESASCRAWVKPCGAVSRNALSVEHRDLNGVSFYPYLDTFTRSQGDTLQSYEESDDEYSYQSTSGQREELNPHVGQVELHDGTWIDEGDACEVDGEYYHMDDCVTCEHSGDWIRLEDAYRVELGRNNTIYIHEDYVTHP
jgi:hypothetical protein